MLNVHSVAEATRNTEGAVLHYLIVDGIGKHVPLLEVFGHVSDQDDTVTMNFFNTVIGGMKTLGAVEIDKRNKTVALTAAGAAVLRDDAQKASAKAVR